MSEQTDAAEAEAGRTDAGQSNAGQTDPANYKPTRGEVRENLRHSMLDGSAWSIMYGIGELYLPALVLALALGDVASGLIATLPSAIGAFMQLGASRGVAWLGSHKRWVVLTALIQALALVPLAICAAVGAAPVWLVFVFATTYAACGQAGGSAWTTWIGTLVPRRIRHRYFRRRQRLLQFCILCGFLTGGFVLEAVTRGVPIPQLVDRRPVLWAFAGLMLVAAAARVLSAYHLAQKTEPFPIPEGHRVVGFPEVWGHLSKGGGEHRGLRLLLFIFAAQFAAKIAEPFIPPYLIENLRQPSMVFAFLIGAPLLGKVLLLSVLGPFAGRLGARNLMLVAGLAIVPLGWLWLVSSSVWWILAVQLLSGAAWACYDLGTWLLILEDVPERERTSVMGYYFLGTWAFSFLGSLVGAGVLKWMPAIDGSPSHTAYMWIFAVSSAVRLVIVLGLLPTVVRRRAVA